MAKKDILFLCQFFYPEHNSSATLPFDTAKYLANYGFSVDALVGYPKEYSDVKNVPVHENIDQVEIHRIRYVQLARAKRLSRLVNYFSFTLSAFLHIFKLRKYKCVITYSNPPILPIIPVLANMMFKTKIVFVAYDVYPEVAYASNSIQPRSMIDKGMQWINHLLYKRVSCVVALTDEMKKFLLEKRPELTEDRVVTIANWAHEKKTEPTNEAYQKFGYKPGQFIVSYFGNMGTCQEMETLVQSVERLKDNDDIRFLFIGHGNKKEVIEQRFKEQGLQNVQMFDFLTGESFEQAVAISSCCVVSLEKGLKGTCAPSKFYSYLQGGKPIIAVVEQGSYLEREVIEQRIGKAVWIGDVTSFIEKIQDMQKYYDSTLAMGKRAESLYKSKYQKSIGTNKYYDMLNKMLNTD